MNGHHRVWFRRDAEELTRATGQPVTVLPIMVIHGAPVGRTGRLVADGVHIVEARRLRRLLKRLPGDITPDDVRRLAEAVERALPRPGDRLAVRMRRSRGTTASP